MNGEHGESEPMMQFFSYAHLPPELREVSYMFSEMAEKICQKLPRNPERTVALRKLLEAKDAGVRAKMYTTTTPWYRNEG